MRPTSSGHTFDHDCHGFWYHPLPLMILGLAHLNMPLADASLMHFFPSPVSLSNALYSSECCYCFYLFLLPLIPFPFVSSPLLLFPFFSHRQAEVFVLSWPAVLCRKAFGIDVESFPGAQEHFRRTVAELGTAGMPLVGRRIHLGWRSRSTCL